MVNDETPSRQFSSEIPMVFKGIVCGFFSFMAWLFASSDEVGRGASIGLKVVSAVSGLFAVLWLLAWVNSLAAQFAGSDGGAMMLDGYSTDDDEHELDTPLEVRPQGMEIRLRDEEHEETPLSAEREQKSQGDDSVLGLISGIIFDILSMFPYFCSAVMMTTTIVFLVTCEIAGWTGLGPAREPNLVSLIVILLFLLSLGFAWRWRSKFSEPTRLRYTVRLVLYAELAALAVCIPLGIVGTLVIEIGEDKGLW